jgi:hypothetical protein
MEERRPPVEVSRRIEAPAAAIFGVLASPQRHTEFDGSGMLRGAEPEAPITGVGDTFTMRMHRMAADVAKGMRGVLLEVHPAAERA